MALFWNSSEDMPRGNQADENQDTTYSKVNHDQYKKKQRDLLLNEFRAYAYAVLMERIDLVTAQQLSVDQLKKEVERFVVDITKEKRVQINAQEQRKIAADLVNDMVGLGPLEELINDDSISDILVNGEKEVYIERDGRLEKIDIHFYGETHLLQIARRIVGKVGRRIDESSPMVDARLPDGSRINIIVPPLSLSGTILSIRRMRKKEFTIDQLIANHSMSEQMASFLSIATECRLNILITGGTGSGKTTLLNSLSRLISHNERIITIENAAELRLQQPHVVRLESRPPNIEGEGEITIRDLVINSLRMRPDRIIVGEVRGEEVLDMMQAMNTGHDGSMSTIHANRPREAITRLENMMAFAGLNIPVKVMRAQIVGAINLIVHVERMRDGARRVTHISEITGLGEDDNVTLSHLFVFKTSSTENKDNAPAQAVKGTFESLGITPQFTKRAEYYGLDKQLIQSLKR